MSETKIKTRDPLVLQLPVPPQRGNRSGGWQVEHYGNRRLGLSSKSQYFEDCAILTNRLVMSRVREFPFSAASYSATVEVFNLFDSDNLVALLKWPIDWITERGIVRDDAPRFLWPKSFPSQIVKRVGTRFLTLTVYPSTLEEIEKLQGGKRCS